MRLLWIFLLLAALVMIPFFIWGDLFEKAFDESASRQWLDRMGQWAWLAAVGLLVADLLLPVPATPILSALGFVYGTIAGGLIGAGGSILSGTIAYSVSRALGEAGALKILGSDGLAKGRRLFGNSGGWIIALSRWMPVLPEVTSCMAGLTRMAPGRFFPALCCGCVPMALAFAWIGEQGKAQPGVAIALSVIVPAVLWGVAALVLRRRHRAAGADCQVEK